jgi:hypothetical protein
MCLFKSTDGLIFLSQTFKKINDQKDSKLANIAGNFW